MPPKPPLTHFLCLPLVTSSSRPHLAASLARFTSEVTTPNEAGTPQLPPKAIRPVGTLHFTIGVMSLPTPERLEAACQFLLNLDIHSLLRDASSSSAGDASASSRNTDNPTAATITETTDTPPQPLPPPPPLTISLTSLHPMHAPSKTSTLYTTPTPTSPLTPFTQLLHSQFRTSGFLLPDPRPLHLHATIVNTIYARATASGKQRWSKDSGKIDATALIRRYEGYEWVMGMRVERVAICEMGARKVVDGEGEGDEIYREVVSVALP